jgi:invasion protein IalB
LTVKEARLGTGQFLAGAALIEQEGEQKKTFRITLPLGMELPQGVRVALDQDPPMSGRYIVCLPNGCMADFEVGVDFVGKLKKSQNVLLQGINPSGQAANYPIPLTDFAEANEGPPIDPAKFEKDQNGAAILPNPIICAAASDLCAYKRIPGGRPPR